MLHKHDEEGPPCRHMENLLQETADGKSRGLKKWYAESHASRCPRCGRFLRSLREMVSRLRGVKPTFDEEAALARLGELVKAGSDNA